MGQRDRAFSCDVNVLGDSLIGVIVFAGAEEKPVMTTVFHPASDQLLGQPGAPVDHQPSLDNAITAIVRTKLTAKTATMRSTPRTECCSSASNSARFQYLTQTVSPTCPMVSSNSNSVAPRTFAHRSQFQYGPASRSACRRKLFLVPGTLPGVAAGAGSGVDSIICSNYNHL